MRVTDKEYLAGKDMNNIQVQKQGFGSVEAYPADLDPFCKDLPENTIHSTKQTIYRQCF